MSLLLSNPYSALAQTPEDVKLIEGYKSVTKLLDTWVESTTNCKTSNDNPYKGNCDRTPVKVMDVLGYKSTTSPLFNMEKTLIKVSTGGELDKVLAKRYGNDVEKIKAEESRFQVAADSYLQSADEGSGLAYISSWGEANPGGGKDRVELFIERARNDVLTAQKNLGIMVDVLDLK
ncbi:hypothetical protein TrRE_jg869 [Triparma retinervis]|uniref:Uncharacterized protein n=1 Tax=Triparma retinervis TaxID=2557542 RepID=A0A9W6ZBR0_9STRA|nr:hypothetical protein TrRE_jg869 [Triparma retinervis]